MKNNNKQNIVSIKIGGQAGQGVKSIGLMLSKVAARTGYHIYNHIEYPSLIRGGHNVMQINISPEEVRAPRKINDLLVALNQDTINKHFTELTDDSAVLFDSDKSFETSKLPASVKLLKVPLSKIAENAGNKELYSNMVALGAVVAYFDGSIDTLKKLISEEFKNKGEEVIKSNSNAAQNGYTYIVENYKSVIRNELKPVDALNTFIPNIVIDGNEAVAIGAITAGLQYAAIYPMSPASGILQVLADNQEKYKYIFKQAEDEISAINMSIGASFAGARSMTSTSGGGFCLMTEGYGLAGITETPLVIVDGMRPGPATGLPTWSEQGDLQMVLNAHQGDFPRIVLAAGDAQEAFELTLKAFNLADKYQTPVVLLLDKNICENDQSFVMFDHSNYKIDRGNFTTNTVADYERYKPSENGISQRTIPGVGNYFAANSDEHNYTGYSTEESDMRNIMMEKRMSKLKTCEKEDMEEPKLFGSKDADITIVSWGSNKGSILHALNECDNVNYLHITWVNPFPTEAIKKILKSAKFILNVECNYTGQMGRLLREHTLIEVNDNLLKYDGRQFYPEEIVKKIAEIKERL